MGATRTHRTATAVGLTVSDDHVAPNARLEVVGTITNLGCDQRILHDRLLGREDVIETRRSMVLEKESLTVAIDGVSMAHRDSMAVDLRMSFRGQ